MNERIKCKTILPTRSKVPDINVWIAVSLHLTPQQQGILGRLDLTGVGCLFGDFLDLEPEDDGPDKAESETRTPVYYFMCSHVLQVDSLFIEEC